MYQPPLLLSPSLHFMMADRTETPSSPGLTVAEQLKKEQEALALDPQHIRRVCEEHGFGNWSLEARIARAIGIARLDSAAHFTASVDAHACEVLYTASTGRRVQPQHT